MNFKNAKFYTLTQSFSIAQSEIERLLWGYAFRPCGSQDAATMGWAEPCPGGKMLSHFAGDYIALALKKEKKLLPSSVINKELAERIEAIEIETGAPVGKKMQADLKQQIMHQLLPQAFTDYSYIRGVLIPSARLVIVDSATDNNAEVFLALLRKTIGSLPVVPMARRSLKPELTHWLTDCAPEKIELLEEAELKSTDDLESVIRCKNQPLDSDEITGHLDNGKLVQRVEFFYDEVFSAVIDEDGSLKRIKFTDRIKEETDDIPKDQVAARFDAELILFAGELVRFAEDMREALSLNNEEVA